MPSQTIGTQSRRPLRREGATILSPAEQSLKDAMMRSSSPIPEPLLGKRTHREGDPTEGGDTEPDGEGETPRAQTSNSNVVAASARYAARKKLRPEQRDELDAFLLVSGSL